MSGEWTVSPDIDITGQPPYSIVIEGPHGVEVGVRVQDVRHSTGERLLAESIAELLNRQVSGDTMEDIMDGRK